PPAYRSPWSRPKCANEHPVAARLAVGVLACGGVRGAAPTRSAGPPWVPTRSAVPKRDECVADLVGDQPRDIATECADLLDQGRRDLHEVRGTGQEDRLDPGEVSVHQRHRLLVGVVGLSANPLDDDARPDL